MKAGDQKNCPVLVTGAAGFIAYHVIRALLERGVPVIGIDNFDSFYDVTLKTKNIQDLQEIAAESSTPFELIEGDICHLDFGSLRGKSIQSVVHLAAKAGVRPSLQKPEEYTRVNVLGTVRILEFCRNSGVQSVAFGSSSSVYGDLSIVPFSESVEDLKPISPYAATKLAGEQIARTFSHLFGLKIAVLRFFTVYGPRQRPDLAIHKFTSLIHQQRSITLFGGGASERDYTYVSDISSGVLSALNWLNLQPPGTFEIFNLGGSETTSLANLVKAIEEALGRNATITYAPEQPGDVKRTFASIEKAERLLGFKRTVPVSQGVPKFVEWFLSNR